MIKLEVKMIIEDRESENTQEAILAAKLFLKDIFIANGIDVVVTKYEVEEVKNDSAGSS